MKNWFKNVKIRTQLMAAFLFVTAITLLVLITAIISVQSLVETNEQLNDSVIVPLESVRESALLMETVKTEGRNLILFDGASDRETNAQRIIEDVNQIKQDMILFGETIAKEEAWSYYDTLMASLDEYLILMDEYRVILSKDLTVPSNYNQAVNYIDNELAPVSTLAIECMTTLNRIRLGLGDELVTAAATGSNQALSYMIAFSIVGIVLSILLGIFMSMLISRPILKGVEVMSRAAKGDFNARLPQDYGAEMGQLYDAFNALVDYNRLNLVTLTDSSSTIRASAQNMLTISTVMADNSRGLNEQTSFVSSTIEEFSAGMMQSSSALSTASTHISAVASSIEEINATIG
ncbi:MAG: methyl-accepting chemotaxis protein, partial [Lachnospiraceae bacterium]|nr:methyl-accepting chemotaxis protein [Lachnospiraceae bacterium]